MTFDPESAFNEGMEQEFKNTPKAEAGFSVGRLPEGIYKVALTAVDLKGDGDLVDHETFQTNSGSIGVKVFMEILEPEDVDGVAVRGEIHEHVFWVTPKNLPYLKRDVATILGRDLESLKELHSVQWAGLTCEISLRDDTYQGRTTSKTAFINPWKPEGEAEPVAEEPATPPAPPPAAQNRTTHRPVKAAQAPAKQKAKARF
jgi:hypothetical protein